MSIEIRFDKKRGCGWRKPGGLYLVSDGLMKPCGKLPIPLSVCPTCHGGIKPTRGFTWVDGDALAAQKECTTARVSGLRHIDCGFCPLAGRLGRCGLLWVGGKFYPTPSDWMKEAMSQGVSRRIPQLPRGLEVGKTWVLVAHREAYYIDCPDCTLGEGEPSIGLTCSRCKGFGEVPVRAIFHAFKPTAVEYVVRGDETPEELDALEKRGITPVKVERVENEPVYGNDLECDSE